VRLRSENDKKEPPRMVPIDILHKFAVIALVFIFKNNEKLMNNNIQFLVKKKKS